MFSKIPAFLLLFFLIIQSGFSQDHDTIYTKDGNKTPCIVDVENDSVVEFHKMLQKEIVYTVAKRFVDSVFTYKESVPVSSQENMNSSESKNMTISEVVKDGSSRTKSKLFDAALTWVGTYFYIDPKDAPYCCNKDSARITIQSKINYNLNFSEGTINYTLRIFAYDGSYQYEFTDFFQEGKDSYNSYGFITNEKDCPPGYGPYQWGMKRKNQAWNEIKDKIRDVVSALTGSLVDHMSKKN
ncbi:MAG TPA: DUF4468 domain-containing protein [Bacteroidales bacterium]|nr:DUF4468 domain-containing protein [Bacteroidales bacterium]